MGTARVTGVKNSPFPSNHGLNFSVRTGGNPGMDSTKTLSKNSHSKVQSSSIWDYNQDNDSSRKKFVMPLKKAIQ
jgi:hypothetical protein